MATAGNPFGGAGGGGNPFDPFVGGATAAQQPGVGAGMAPGYGAPNPYQAPPGQAPGGAPAMQQYPNQQPAGMAPSQSPYQQQAPPPAQPPAQPDPWGAPQAAQPVQQQFQPQAGAYGQPQPAQTYQQPSQAAGGYDPFGATQAPAGQMVVSQQQSNPYAGLVAPTPPTPTPDYGAQAIVPAQQPANPWGVQQQQQVQPPPAYGAPPPAAGGYDPFASAPVPAPAPPPAPVAQQPAYPAPQAPVAAAPPSNVVDENPFGPLTPVVPQETQIVPSQQQQMQQYSSERTDDSNSRAIVPAPANGTVRNQYAGELARKAPPGASPLPKAELVKKRGYVLSRISFRTIVMKKWKQSYWVQYGSHTMLWFRSQSDFEDWLNNPYHSQAQRNFLIKLAVNFVHDLYKPNVRGYQVTQCRVKPYGNKTVRQFKLERWMDYGPTIAAAFGAYDPKEVDALREAIVECMRNTPLDGGIRATGAVRQMPDAHNEGAPIAAQDNNDYQSSDMHERFNSGVSAYTQPNPSIAHSQRVPVAARSVVSAADLLDDHNNFDDTASLPPTSAMVPAAFPPQSYPGAPPPPQQQNPFGFAPAPPVQQVPQQVYQQQPAYGQAPPTPQPYQQAPAPVPQYNAAPHVQQQYQQPPPAQAYGQPPAPQQQQFGYQQQQSHPF